MKKCLLVVSLLLLPAGSGFTQLRSCPGAVSLEDFRLIVEGPKGSPAIPLARINRLHAGTRLRFEPATPGAEGKPNARIGVILVPAAAKQPEELTVLETRPAQKPAEWLIPFDVSIIGIVFGPQGLDVKKVNSLVTGNHQLIAQLADYAQQTTEVGALVESLAVWEQNSANPRGLDAVLRGFSSRYGVALPRLNTDARPDEQAALLLKAILPSLASYDPLTTEPAARMQQSAGLAASLASLFFGSPVTLAAGGTALFQNLRALMFPDTEFRSAFAQFRSGDRMSLCSKPLPMKSRTRAAFLWALRLPASDPPALSLASDYHLPVGWKSPIKLTSGDPSQLKLLPRVQEWQLKSLSAREAPPTRVATTISSADLLQMDLTQPLPAPGAYRLVGRWDWNTFEVNGTVHLYPMGDLTAAKITQASEDRLVEGSGVIPVTLTGTDFQFVAKVSLIAADKPDAVPAGLSFTLPRGEFAGVIPSLEIQVDTTALRRGDYRLRITQLNGESRDLPLKIHPPNPLMKHLPLRANIGEPNQAVVLRGSGLERVERIAGQGMNWTLTPAGPGEASGEERKAILVLDQTLHKGEHLDISLSVQGLHQPLQFTGAVEIVGPRPAILSVEQSIPPQLSVELRNGEIPAGIPVSFALRTANLESAPLLDLACRHEAESRPALTLRPGESRNGANLDLPGEGILFLSLDPGSLGSTGCDLTAAVRSELAGSSSVVVLGRVIRMPQIERFELTEQMLDGSQYAGSLTGRELQTIEKAGWDARHGFPVLGIPTPKVGEPGVQTLKVALPWPSPSPRAPIFIWLRGETDGRATRARF